MPLAYKGLWTFEPNLVTKKVHRLCVYKQKRCELGGKGGYHQPGMFPHTWSVLNIYVSVGLSIYTPFVGTS